MYLETEIVPYGPGRSFASICYEGPEIVCPYHRHVELELVSVDSSEGRLVVGDHVGTFRTGDLFFFGKNLPHFFQNVRGRPAREAARTHVIQFRRDFAGGGLFEVPEFRPLARLLHRARRGLKVDSTDARKAVRKQMRAVHEARQGHRVTALLELLLELAACKSLEPLASVHYDPESLPSDGRMPVIMAYIHENFREAITVTAAAARAGLTPNAFCRYFKIQTRRTFIDVVNEMRIKEACRLLEQTSFPVTEVAYASGFANLAHFYAEFRKRMHCSPRRHREEAR